MGLFVGYVTQDGRKGVGEKFRVIFGYNKAEFYLSSRT